VNVFILPSKNVTSKSAALAVRMKSYFQVKRQRYEINNQTSRL